MRCRFQVVNVDIGVGNERVDVELLANTSLQHSLRRYS